MVTKFSLYTITRSHICSQALSVDWFDAFFNVTILLDNLSYVKTGFDIQHCGFRHLSASHQHLFSSPNQHHQSSIGRPNLIFDSILTRTAHIIRLSLYLHEQQTIHDECIFILISPQVVCADAFSFAGEMRFRGKFHVGNSLGVRGGQTNAENVCSTSDVMLSIAIASIFVTTHYGYVVFHLSLMFPIIPDHPQSTTSPIPYSEYISYIHRWCISVYSNVLTIVVW